MREMVLLDTSALLALRDDEPGAQRVAALLVDSAKGPAPNCLACFMSRMEVWERGGVKWRPR
jgi:ribonuclease VapC